MPTAQTPVSHKKPWPSLAQEHCPRVLLGLQWGLTLRSLDPVLWLSKSVSGGSAYPGCHLLQLQALCCVDVDISSVPHWHIFPEKA